MTILRPTYSTQTQQRKILLNITQNAFVWSTQFCGTEMIVACCYFKILELNYLQFGNNET